MNRFVIALIMGLIIFLVLPYLYVPSTIRKSLMAIAPASPAAAQVAFTEDHRWKDWWPFYDSTQSKNGTYIYNGHPFRAGKKFVSGIELISDHTGDSTKGLLLFIPYGQDSVRITWELIVRSSLNPLTRIQQQRSSKRLQKDMTVILQKAATYISNEENIYGIKVDHKKITDSLLLMTRSMVNHNPNLATIYGLVDKLQQYAAQSGATATNAPMLHIRPAENKQVEIMVALPVNKVIKGAGAIEFKRMYPGNVLETAVQGGPYAVNKAFGQLSQYIIDKQYTSPAIPFELLVTNRMQEADTSKWTTKIYYPIF